MIAVELQEQTAQDGFAMLGAGDDEGGFAGIQLASQESRRDPGQCLRAFIETNAMEMSVTAHQRH